jgi:hypothetical protein
MVLGRIDLVAGPRFIAEVHMSTTHTHTHTHTHTLYLQVIIHTYICGPTLPCQVLAYGYKSAVVRSNISALWTASAAASSRVKFRQRLNASEANFKKKN